MLTFAGFDALHHRLAGADGYCEILLGQTLLDSATGKSAAEAVRIRARR
jgi:hypothetical protein